MVGHSMNGSRLRRTRQGASLIEILVVIVIFTVGILGAVQVFPGGLAILRANKSNTVADALARAEMERMKADVEQLPDAVFALNYPVISATLREREIDLQRRVGDLSPPSQVTGMDNQGVLFDVDGGLGNWQLFTGGNIMRQVVGEGRRIPAPRFVDGPAGARFGGVLTLQFAPLFLEINANDPDLGQIPFLVYGNDLIRRITDGDVSDPFPVREDYISFVESENDTANGQFMTLPQGAFRPDLPAGANSRAFRVSARVRFTDGGGNVVAQDLVRVVRLQMAASGQPRFNVPINMLSLFADPSGTLSAQYVEPDTVTVARLFEQVTNFLTDAQIQSSSGLLDDAVYQYQVLNDRLGIFLFHPRGAQYTERRVRGRLPMRARVDYSVLDWRNLRDDFRVPSTSPFQQRLVVQSLKVGGNRGPDGRVYNGLGFQVPDGAGGLVERDFLVVDRETGAIVLPSSYQVDKSLGIVSFVDVDNNLANGLTADVVYAGTNVTERILDVRNRAFRAIYQANQEYAVVPSKAFTRYRGTFSSTLGVGQFYIGGTDAGAPLSLPTRLYFPLGDVGRKVVVGEVWYTDAGGNRRNLVEQEFIIRGPGPTDWNRYGFIDIRDKDANAAQFDFSFGYAVTSVRGASVGVRVLWNPSSFVLTGDPAENMRRLGAYLSNTRQVRTETFMMRGAEE